MASASFALGLSASLVNSSVLSGSTSLRRKSLPLVTLNGLARSCAASIISFVFIKSSSVSDSLVSRCTSVCIQAVDFRGIKNSFADARKPIDENCEPKQQKIQPQKNIL